MAGGYPELVAPLIPDAQHNKSPEILLEGLRTGLAAFAQFAQIRRQSEMETLRLAQNERLAQDQHAIERARISRQSESDAAQHAIEQQKIRQSAELIPSQIKANEAHTSLITEQGIAYHEGVATAAQIKRATDASKRTLFDEVAKTVQDFKLDDVHFQTKEPMAFARNVIKFKQMYHLSPSKEVRRAIKDYQAIADEQKLYIRHGVEDEHGKVKAEGEGRQVPAWRIVMNVQDPLTQEQTMRDLEASGYFDVIKSLTSDGTKSKSMTLRHPLKQYMAEAKTIEQGDSADPAVTPKPVMPDYGSTGTKKLRVRSPSSKEYPNGQIGYISVEQRESALSQGFTILEQASKVHDWE